MYDAISDIGKYIKIIADTGATISLANVKDLEAVGPYYTTGTTKISGVANKPIEETETILISLNSDFANKKQKSTFEVAVLPTITHVNVADHTKAIEEALKALERKCPDFMTKHKNYFHINNFQVSRSSGDVYLLLSNAEHSLHPKVLVQFKDGPAIALIRQETPNNKFLILAGRTKTAVALENADVEIDRYSVQQATHLRHEEVPDEKDKIQHVFCCVLDKHEDHELVKHEKNEKEDAENSSDEEDQNQDENSGKQEQVEMKNVIEEHSDDLFPENDKIHKMKTRAVEKYKVQYANTERFKKSSIIAMQKMLNHDTRT